jgi:hypothetical protein
MLELRLGLAVYCCRVRHGSPVNSPEQGLPGEGTMLNLSQLEYWTALRRTRKNVAKVGYNIFISMPDSNCMQWLYIHFAN